MRSHDKFLALVYIFLCVSCVCVVGGGGGGALEETGIVFKEIRYPHTTFTISAVRKSTHNLYHVAEIKKKCMPLQIPLFSYAQLGLPR